MIVKRTELDLIRKNSLCDCHVIGLDSVVFNNTPGARVRAYVTQPGHELWMNDPFMKYPMSLAFHPHHCDLTLTPIFGTWENVRLQPSGELKYLRRYREYKYVSEITEGAGGFVDTGMIRKWYVNVETVLESRFMDAKEIHTVYVPNQAEAAWYVHEHKEDPYYLGLNYSNTDLELWSPARLYRPMSEDRLLSLLDRMKIKVK